ncbi:MAG: acyl carrier protein [Candidatus Latescibacterota bacterium]|nr:MAG: acyl carrier protein [Candidatus Latescibacterota bacterium]
MSQPPQFNEAQVKERLKKFVVDNFLVNADSKNVGDNDSFLEQGIIDSTGVLELVGFIEETFSMRVEDEELIPDNLDSLNQLVVYIKSKTHSQ